MISHLLLVLVNTAVADCGLMNIDKTIQNNEIHMTAKSFSCQRRVVDIQITINGENCLRISKGMIKSFGKCMLTAEFVSVSNARDMPIFRNVEVRLPTPPKSTTQNHTEQLTQVELLVQKSELLNSQMNSNQISTTPPLFIIDRLDDGDIRIIFEIGNPVSAIETNFFEAGTRRRRF